MNLRIDNYYISVSHEGRFDEEVRIPCILIDEPE